MIQQTPVSRRSIMCCVHAGHGRSWLSQLPISCSSKQLIIVCYHLSLLFSLYPVNVKFSKPSFLIRCPRYSRCLLLILNISVVLFRIFFNVSSVLTYSVQWILSIHLQSTTSVDLSNLFFWEEIFQHSLPYSRIDITQQLIALVSFYQHSPNS